LLPLQFLIKNFVVPSFIIFIALVGTNSEAHGGQYDSDIIFVASQYQYVREKTNKNDAPEIDKWLKFTGLDNPAEIKRNGSGYSYCAAFGCSVIAETYGYHNKKTPFFRNARCSEIYKLAKKDKYTYTVISANNIFNGAYTLHEADIAIWSSKKKREFDWNGHFGIVTKQFDPVYFEALEANTIGPNSTEGQREQVKGSKNIGGVFFKKRNTNPNWSFNPEGFIRIN
jgi:hypothetical protein